MNRVIGIVLCSLLMFATSCGRMGAPAPTPGEISITLSWNPSPDGLVNHAVGYHVYRGTKPGQELKIPISTSPVSVGCSSRANCSFTDSISKSSEAYYTVRAVWGNVESPDSNTWSVHP